ncbi:uncharacterized protein TNCV_3046211 [Trichonephila clavipes]|uniref:Uncharacterized protein n=1 Tax=Trichonephila clavipes TaxID=2585209 RepID=A0A8X6RM50_TRICX|nr:uncharacterized protein TNCV_3046211 [Trichonephila clavipes]
MDKTTLPVVKKMKDLINGEYTIPEKLDCFFKALIGGKDIRRRDGVNCHRTDKPFSSIPIDLTLEQIINSEAARCLSGIAHFTNSLAACQRWTKTHSIRATIISYVLDVCGLKQLQDVSADLQPNRIKIYGKQLSDFNEIFENDINPFDESLDKDILYNITTAKLVPENVANFLLNIEQNGEDLRKQFITECAEDQNRFDKPIKKPSA